MAAGVAKLGHGKVAVIAMSSLISTESVELQSVLIQAVASRLQLQPAGELQT